jgi:hypothetical protein
MTNHSSGTCYDVIIGCQDLAGLSLLIAQPPLDPPTGIRHRGGCQVRGSGVPATGVAAPVARVGVREGALTPGGEALSVYRVVLAPVIATVVDVAQETQESHVAQLTTLGCAQADPGVAGVEEVPDGLHVLGCDLHV